MPGAPSCPGHSATAVDKGAGGKPLFDSGIHRAAANDKATTFPFTVRFNTPGTYKYFCSRHDTMTGEVVVS